MWLKQSIDTEACKGYAQQIAQVMALYEPVWEWTLSEYQKCSKVIAENSYVDMSDPTAPEKMAKANAAASRQMGLTTVQSLVGNACLARLEKHFLEVVNRINRVEQAICSRGEKLFDL